MSFPECKFPDIAAFCDEYFSHAARAAASVDRISLAAAARILTQVYVGGASAYVCGNGGSASISNHLVCDHMKGVQTDTELLPHVTSLSSNIELVTAIANDIAYTDVFLFQLRSLVRRGDVLITISSSGDSENVVRAAQWARDNGIAVISMTGFSGGRTAKLADVNLHVKSDNYGVVEDTHQALMHILAQYLRQAHMDPNLVRQRKF